MKPTLVAEVSFAEWTESGHIRHSVFHGLRADKEAKFILREQAESVANVSVGRSIAGKKDPALPQVRVTHPQRVIDCNTAAKHNYNSDTSTGIKRRVASLGTQPKYLNNIDQNHRGGQTIDPRHAGIQLVPVCGNYSHWKRTHAHDPQGPNELPRHTWPGATILFVNHLKRLKIPIFLGRSKTLRQNAAKNHRETRLCH